MSYDVKVDGQVISVKTKGARDALVYADRARKKMRNFSPVNKAASIMLDRWVQLNFRTEGGKVGGWESFAHGGRVVKKAKATGKKDGYYINATAKLLKDTGALRLSYYPFHSNRIAGVGTKMPYAKKQQKGDPKRNLPARRMLPEPPDVQAELRRLYGKHVRASLRA